MEQLQHDPRTKQVLKNSLYEYVYSPMHLMYKRRIDSIIVRNTVLMHYSHKSFLYKAVFYSCEDTPPPRKFNRLSPQLTEEMDEYLSELNHLNRTELPYVVNYITSVLNASNHMGDYLQLFPEAIHTPIQKFIDSCPCKHCSLSEEQINEIKEANKQALTMLKKRLISNLLI